MKRREEGRGKEIYSIHYRSFELKDLTKRSTCTKVREEEGERMVTPTSSNSLPWILSSHSGTTAPSPCSK